MKLVMAYHENGGNESFEIGKRGGYMLGLKALSDPACTHNFIVLSDSSTGAGTRARSSQRGGMPRCASRRTATTVL